MMGPEETMNLSNRNQISVHSLCVYVYVCVCLHCPARAPGVEESL